MVVSLLVAVLAAAAFAENGEEESSASETTFQVPAGMEAGGTLGAATPIEPLGETNPAAAEILPHDDLARGEAAELLHAVFEEPLGTSSGVFDGLQVEHFHSDHVAVVDDGDSNNLLQSLLPLRTETGSGAEKVVDLDLVPVGDGDLEPDNPLVAVEIPSELGEGIRLPESSIEVTLAGAPAERAPSIIDGGAAFFPNVAQDSDFTVVPTPTGVETFAHLRTPDAPLSQTYEISLPSGAILEERGGGAEITREGEIIAIIHPPTAIDAEGDSVPVSLSVSGSSIVVTSAPEPGTAYPILVDPIFDTYYWSLNNNQYGLGTDWVATSSHSLFEARSYGYGGGEKGLNIYSYGGTVPVGTQANWNYHVPRYYSDFATYGVRPTSFINKMDLSNMNWWIEGEPSPYKANPFVMAGLWDVVNNKHVSLAVKKGTEGQWFNSWTELKNPNENVGVKEGGIALLADNDTQSRYRHLWVGQASVELSDKDYPSFVSVKGPSKWINGLTTDNTNLAEPIQFEASDAGLGVFALLAKTPKLGGGTNQWEQTPGCPGNATVSCPRVWSGGYWNYNPKLMPQGENVVEMIGKDPVWHFSDQASPSLAAKVKVKVDRTNPSLALSGSLTEQATLGTWLPAYTLKVNATDGTEGAPQAGVAKLAIKVDGVVVDEVNPGCATKNCTINREWTMDADSFSVGSHAVQVIATDGAGISQSQTVNVTLHGDQTNPSLTLTGTMTQQASLGTTRPAYTVRVNATDPGPSEERKSGVATTTVKVDGKVVDTTSPGCSAGGCSIIREWTLDSNSYSVGSHAIEVKATDDAGRSTTKSLTINIARDNTPPQFYAPGPFYNAPEGWLEHKSYSYYTLATDNNGYGVTSFTFKIDGNVIKSASGTCPAGGCGRELAAAQTIDMNSFVGGAHPAELIASDGAGNVAKRTWTINVDPDGNISIGEATDTLEAVEDTAPEATELTPVEGLVTEQSSDGGSNPSLGLVEGELVSKGTSTPAIVNLNPEEGFAVETTALDAEEHANSEQIDIVPVEVGTAAANAQITDGSAAVIPNSSTNVDTIIRPAYDGLMTFQAIRDKSAPEGYSWEVKLGEGETLELIDQKHAAIYWEDGTQAMLIAGQSAHGADGKAVATSLTVSEGNIITLTVDHRAAEVVYPVVAGVGWEGGFQTHQATIVVPEEEELGASISLVVAPPQIVGYEERGSSGEGNGATASASSLNAIPKLLSTWGIPICDNVSCDLWERRFRGFHWYNYKKAWYPGDRKPVCIDDIGTNHVIEENECDWVGPNNQPLCKPFSGGPGDPCETLHITARTRFQAGREALGFKKVIPIHVVMRAWATGDIHVYNSDQICNPMKPACTGDHVISN